MIRIDSQPARSNPTGAQPATSTSTRQNAPTDVDALVGFHKTDFEIGQIKDNSLPSLSEVSIQLDTTKNNYIPVINQGFSKQRPEILSVIGFEPVYDSVSESILSSAGELLEIQLAAKNLYSENVIRLINELRKNDNLERVLSDIENEIFSLNSEAEKEVTFLSNMVKALASARKSFDIKLNSSAIKKQMSSARSRFGDDHRQILRETNPVKSPSEILYSDLQFSQLGVQNFTNTKVLAQLLDDLRVIISSFTPDIFAGPHEKRLNDIDPISILHLDDVRSNNSPTQRFNISAIASSGQPDVVDGATRASFDKFLAGISPFTLDDRIKLLCTILSKELRVSSGLSSKNIIDTLSSFFNVGNTGNVFHDILGSVDGDILKPVQANPESIASLLRVQSNGDVVLPFEPMKVMQYLFPFIPGRDFYVDSIIKGTERFNAEPYVNYANAFSSKISALAYIIEGTLDVNVINSQKVGINPDNILNLMTTAIQKFVTYVTPGHTSTTTRDELTLAVMSSANEDDDLKYLLFLKMLLDGFYDKYSPNTVAGKHTFYDGLEHAGLNADQVINSILAIGEATYTRGISIQGEFADAVTFGDTAKLQNIGQVRASPGVNPVIERIIPTQQVIGELIVRHIILQQANYTEVVYPTGATVSSASNVNNTTGIHDRNISDTWAKSKLSSVNTILRELNSVLNEIDSAAKLNISSTDSSRNPKGYFDNTRCGLTKFNGIGAHTLAMIVLEIAVSTISNLNFMNLAGVKTDQLPSIDIVVSLDDKAAQIASAVLRSQSSINSPVYLGFTDQSSRADYALKKSRFDAIKNSLTVSDNLTMVIVESLVAVSHYMKNAASDVSLFFDVSNGPNSEMLTKLDVMQDAKEKFSSFDQAQVDISRVSLEEQKTSQIQATKLLYEGNMLEQELSAFVGINAVLPGVKSALLSLMKDPLFSYNATNIQLLSVGLPAGFMDSLRTRISTFNVGENLSELEKRLNVQNDIIAIDVYMQDMLFDEIVFKPKTFIFETGRFVMNSGFSSIRNSSLTFDSLVNEQIITTAVDADSAALINNIGVSGPESSISNDETYSFLTNEQKDSLIKNHIISYLLSVYTKLLTGVSITELDFLISDDIASKTIDSVTRERFIELLTTHISQLANRSVTLDEIKNSSPEVKNLLSRLDENEETKSVTSELIKIFSDVSDSANIEISQDLITFIKTFSKDSIIFGAGARKEMLTSPKLFERIFHIPITPDAFEIDEVATSSTTAGQKMLMSRTFQENLINEGIDERLEGRRLNIEKRKQQGSLSLQQFFITVRQLPEFPSTQPRSLPPAVKNLPDVGVRNTTDIINTSPAPRGLLDSIDVVSDVSVRQEIKTSAEITRANDPSRSLLAGIL